MSLNSVEGDYGRYLFEYRFGGSEWGLTITAKDPEEARERLKAISWARYKGEVAAIIPIPDAGLLERTSRMKAILTMMITGAAFWALGFLDDIDP